MTSATIGGAAGLAHVITSAPLPPRNYCTPTPNTTGVPARISYRRSTSITDNELQLAVASGPPGELAVLLYGTERGVTPLSVPIAAGSLCVAGGIYRVGPVFLDGTGGASLDLDFAARPLGAGPGAAAPGSTLYFQWAYRDGFGAVVWNASDGLAVTFCP